VLFRSQELTGSVGITGSLVVNGASTFSSDIILPYSKALAFNSISNQYLTADATNLYLGTANLSRLVINTGGQVIIGDTSMAYTNAQGYALGIKSASTAQTFISIVRSGQTLGSQGINIGLDTGAAYFFVYDNLPTIFRNNAVETMRISSGGNVGIGVNAPGEKLHIYGGGLGPEIRLEGTWGSHWIRAYSDNLNLYTAGGRQAISMNNAGSVFNYSNTTTWQQTSDIRVKENINTISNALEVITSLNPVSFNYKQEFAEKNNWDDSIKLNNIGFIAQEFETVFPKYVYNKEYSLGDSLIEDFKSIDTGHLVPFLVKAIQEQQAQIDELKAKLQ
jgi:hypothetical protein